MTVLHAQDLTRRFGKVTAVSGVSLTVDAGEWVSLVGPSGCGKTTLLQVLRLLDRPTSGELPFSGIDPLRISPAARLFRCPTAGSRVDSGRHGRLERRSA